MLTSLAEVRYDRWMTLSAVLAAALFTAAGFAQPPSGKDYLDQVRKREDVARQKIERDLGTGLREVQTLTVSNPTKAIERLKGLQNLLESDTVLTEERRGRLLRMVKDRIRVTELEKANVEVKEAAKEDKSTARRLLEEHRAAENERMRREIEALRQQKPGQSTQDAAKQAADVARRNPNNPAATAASRINQANDQLGTARRTDTDRQRALAGVNRDIERAATPPASDWELPKDWVERTKGRTAGQNLTAKEKAILTALASPVMINFKNSRFEDVIEYLSTLTGQPILIDPTALKEAEVTYDTPVSLNAKGVTVRTALRRILAELGMSYIIKEETIQVMSLARVRETLMVQSYPVADLVILQRPEFGQFGGRPVSPLEVQKNVEELIALIQNSIDSASWQINGGNGTIAYHAPSNSLIIKQTAEVHMMLGRRPGSK